MKSNRISKTQTQSPGFRVDVSRNNDSRKMESINTPTTLQNEANMAKFTKREQSRLQGNKNKKGGKQVLGLTTMQEELDNLQAQKTDKNYVEVFDALFKEKMKQYYKEQIKKLRDEEEGIVEERLFCFAEKKFKEIEALVKREHEIIKGIVQKQVTKLDNESAATTTTQIQKEMLQGRYKILLRETMPYSKKIEKMASEPVAYQLYKRRHFHSLCDKGIAIKAHARKKDFKTELLQIANAKIIHTNFYQRIKRNAIAEGRPLNNRILNLPKDEEQSLKNNLVRAVMENNKAEYPRNIRKHICQHLLTNLGSDDEMSDDERGGKKHAHAQDANELCHEEKYQINRIMYTPQALQFNQIYIFEEQDSRIHASDLVTLVMDVIQQDIKVRRKEVKKKLDAKKKALEERRQKRMQHKENPDGFATTMLQQQQFLDSLIDNNSSQESLSQIPGFQEQFESYEANAVGKANFGNKKYSVPQVDLRPINGANHLRGATADQNLRVRDFNSNRYSPTKSALDAMKRIVATSETPRIKTLMRNNLPLQLMDGLQPRAPSVVPSSRPRTTLYNGPQISIDNNKRRNFGSRLSNTYGSNNDQSYIQQSAGFKEHQIDMILSDAQSQLNQRALNQKLLINQSKYKLMKIKRDFKTIQDQNRYWTTAPDDNKQRTVSQAPIMSVDENKVENKQNKAVFVKQEFKRNSIIEGSKFAPLSDLTKKQQIEKKKNQIGQIEQKQGLIKISHNCNKFNYQVKKQLKEITSEIEDQKCYNQQFDRVCYKLRELENIKEQLMPQIYEYRETIERQQNQEAQDVAYDFKIERMDLKRPIINWENKANIKRRNDLMRKTKLINKGKDSECVIL